MKGIFQICFLCCFFALGCSKDKDIPIKKDCDRVELVITSSWTCQQCRHGNPDNIKRCEYCGYKRDAS